MDTQLDALPTLPVLARGVSGCLNSAFSQQISTFYGPSVQAMDTQLGARHQWRTPTIHRGSAERRIGVRATGGLQVTRQRSETGRHAVADDEPVRRPCPCPNQRIKSDRKENTRQLQLCSMPASPASRLRSVSPPCPPHQCGELVQVDGLDGVVVAARLA